MPHGNSTETKGYSGNRLPYLRIEIPWTGNEVEFLGLRQIYLSSVVFIM